MNKRFDPFLWAILALWVPPVPAAAQLENPDIHAGFPSYAYCHYEYLDWVATGNSLSTAGDQFSDRSSTSTLVVPTNPVPMYNGVSAIGSVGQNLTAVGDAAVRTQDNVMALGIGQAEFFFMGRELVASTAGDNYTERLGFFDSDTTPVDGVYFRYDSDVNSGEWEAVAIAAGGGAETTVDTNVVFTADTSRRYYINVNADATIATFYIDAILVATISTAADIPNGTEYTGAGWSAQETVDTADQVPMSADYMAMKVTFTTPRC